MDAKPKEREAEEHRSQKHDPDSSNHHCVSTSADERSPAAADVGREDDREETSRRSCPSPDAKTEADARGKSRGKGRESPDPLDRIETVTRTSLAGSLRFVSAAMRGVGEAVFQAGTVAEGLAGGTGRVAGTL